MRILVALALAGCGGRESAAPKETPAQATAELSDAAAKPAASWTEVASRDQLIAALEAGAGSPVIIHVRAEWAVPSRKLELRLAEPDAAAALARHLRLTVDVTDGKEATEEIQELLDAPTVPAVLVFFDPAPLAAFLRGKAGRPAPTDALRDMSDLEAFVGRLGP